MDQVAVIVPIYRVEAYLEACVASIRAQTYTNLAIVLVDDGSPDRCGAMSEAFAREDSRITVLHRPNGGLSAARNTGLDWVAAHSVCKWVAFVDSDDTLHPDFVKALVEGVTTHGVEIASVTYEKVFAVTTGAGSRTVMFDCVSPESFWCRDQVQATVSTCKLFAARLFASVRFPEGKLHEDELTTYRVLFAVPRVAVSKTSLYFYLQRADSIMGREDGVWTPDCFMQSAALHVQAIFLWRHGFKSAYYTTILSLMFCYAKQYCDLKRQSAYRAYRPLLRKWTRALLRVARRDGYFQMGDLWLGYFVLWPFWVNRVTWPFIRAYDLVVSVGWKGLTSAVGYHFSRAYREKRKARRGKRV